MASIKLHAEKLIAGNIPSFVELYGNNPEVLRAQANDYLSLARKFETTYGDGDIMFFSSPGRTEIGGNHTDHNNGRVLAGAVTLDNIAVAAPNNKSIVRIKSEGYPEIVVNLSDLSQKEDEKFTSTAIVRGICSRLKEIGLKVDGFDACLTGRVPKGSGLSSSASFEVLIGCIISELFNKGALCPVENAKAGQYAENNFFGKPCGLMDQTACSVGGLIAIDFENPLNPEVKRVNFNFSETGYQLVITDTGGNHADLNDEYASLPAEMKAVAMHLGKSHLRELTLPVIVDAMPAIREKTGDRALLRAFHFQGENQRVADQVKALELGNINEFLKMVVDSGYSSFMYNQNIYPTNNTAEQGVSLGLALSEMVLKGRGAWRVHGGGFAGTIQAFVPTELIKVYVKVLEHLYGQGACQILSIRSKGVCRVQIV